MDLEKKNGGFISNIVENGSIYVFEARFQRFGAHFGGPRVKCWESDSMGQWACLQMFKMIAVAEKMDLEKNN